MHYGLQQEVSKGFSSNLHLEIFGSVLINISQSENDAIYEEQDVILRHHRQIKCPN